MKRVLNVFLTLCLLFAIVPLAVSAEAGPSTATSGEAGPTARYTFNANTGELRITGTGEIYSVNSMEYDHESAPWGPLREQIKKVTISAGITRIGDAAFRSCINLTTVTIPDSVAHIGAEAFRYCPVLTNVDFPSNLTYIGAGAFQECAALTEVILPEGLIYIRDNAFFSCDNITRVELPSTLESLGDAAFRECKSLTSITIPRSVYQMEGAFSSCYELRNVTIHSDTVSIMERDFSSCDKLEYIHILGDAPVSDIERLFGDPLTISLDFRVYYDEGTSGWNPPNWNGYEIMIWGQPDPVRTGTCGHNVTWTLDDGLLTISGTGPMTDYNFTNAYEEGQSPSYGFFQRKIKEVVIEEGVTRIGTHAFDNSSHIGSYTNMVSVTIPSTVKQIGANAFDSSGGLENVNIAEGLLEIEDGAFRDCDALEAIALPSSIKIIGDHAFSDCNSLVNINLPDSITYIGGYAFTQSLLDQYITIPAGMTTIPQSAFSSAWIKGVEIHDGVTQIESSAFYGCRYLENVTIPGSVTSIGNNAFSNCDALQTAAFVGDAPEVGSDVFGQNPLTVYYPENNETWTAEAMQAYGERITWVPYHNHEYAEDQPVYGQDKTHSWTCIYCGDVTTEACTFGDGEVTIEATASSAGVREYTCTVCGGSYEEAYILRIYGANRYETAFQIADILKEQLGVEKFENIIVASGKDFPDALAGSYLAAVKDAPILLVNQYFIDEVEDYIAANLAEGGKVYLLGGESAVPAEMEAALTGYDVTRLAGANRLVTNLAILEEAGVGDQEILICTGWGFADSLAASAVGKPILLVNNRGLTEEQKTFLAASSGKFVIIGGESAVNADIATALEAYGTVERVQGANRYETSVEVAERFFENPEAAILAYAQNFPDGLCGGPLAYSLGAPMLLIATNRGPAVGEYVHNSSVTAGAVLGGTGLIDEATVNSVFGA